MLKSLFISNYALISNLRIDFDGGFSVITGETGAGKSIIVGALSLIQGQRADTRVVKEGTQKSVVEAGFEIENYNLKSFFKENELDYNPVCLVRREITINGKSRAFINDTPVSLNALRDLSNRLLDIHSQHENLLLSTEDYQLQVVDAIARNKAELSDYQHAYEAWNKSLNELQKLKREADRQTADLDYLQFQLSQLDDANLTEGELAELEAELDTLSHVEEIKHELQQAEMLLSSEEYNVVNAVRETGNVVLKIKNYLPEASEWAERLTSLHIELKDIALEISSTQERIDFNPERLQFVDDRLGTLFVLQKKFKVTSDSELIALREEYRNQLNRIDNFDEELKNAEEKVRMAFETLKTKASALTASRNRAKPVIEKYLIEQLLLLGMADVQFVVNLKNNETYTEKGNDAVEFMFSANKNRSVQAVAEIASGGEISRLMLAIKSLLIDKSDLPTIIFDEIDTGVSGEIAGRMGEIMRKMSHGTQVITITHLPQIASKGSAHYLVYKDNSGITTETFIKSLTEQERVHEIAQMVSGKTVTDAALMNARELLKNSN
ncbi:MAG: replication and repair protein RecN [Bacteroidetes bacterium]|nr:replication and repair protein RecN [Bacteroidota bacterium]